MGTIARRNARNAAFTLWRVRENEFHNNIAGMLLPLSSAERSICEISFAFYTGKSRDAL